MKIGNNSCKYINYIFEIINTNNNTYSIMSQKDETTLVN